MNIENIVKAAQQYQMRDFSFPIDLPCEKEGPRFENEPASLSNISLSSEDAEFIDELIRESGVDSLAYYIPYHSDPINWGIYIYEHGIVAIAEKIVRHGLSRNEAERIAKKILLVHEQFHFLTELATSTLESLTRQAVYAPLFKANYSIEEALANAYAWNKVVKPLSKGVQLEIDAFFRSCPVGYNQYSKYTNKKLTGGIREYLALWNQGSSNTTVTDPGELLYQTSNGTIASKLDKIVPVYRIHGTVQHIGSHLPFCGRESLKTTIRMVEKFCEGTLIGHNKHKKYQLDNGAETIVSNPHSKEMPNGRVTKIAAKAGYTLGTYNTLKYETKNFKKKVPRRDFYGVLSPLPGTPLKLSYTLLGTGTIN